MAGATRDPVALSAPGKVLLAGGYLALDREYTAFVYGLKARISVIAQEIQTSPGVQLTEIVVESPQFLEAQWHYGYHLSGEDGGIKVTQLQVGTHIDHNPFVETTLGFALTYIARISNQKPIHSIQSCRLTILADNDYYSQPPSSSGPPAPSFPLSSRFANFSTRLSSAKKTGLGSSAALVTALSAALLSHYLPVKLFSLETPTGRSALHNLAQAAHCAAQGKVGSGFDVAAAVYGSCCYRRFSPALLLGLPDVGSPRFAPQLKMVVDAQWDAEVDKGKVGLPEGVVMRMCDVDCGTQTVGMVKKVLAWKRRSPEAAKTLWNELQRRDERLVEVLRTDGAAAKEKIRPAIRAVRELVKKMGDLAGVPIEPDMQTELLDALEDVEGVYGGLVPGAGGFDALALLMRDDEETIMRIQNFLKTWSQVKGLRVRLLGTEGEMEGLRLEDLDAYEGWLTPVQTRPEAVATVSIAAGRSLTGVTNS